MSGPEPEEARAKVVFTALALSLGAEIDELDAVWERVIELDDALPSSPSSIAQQLKNDIETVRLR